MNLKAKSGASEELSKRKRQKSSSDSSSDGEENFGKTQEEKSNGAKTSTKITSRDVKINKKGHAKEAEPPKKLVKTQTSSSDSESSTEDERPIKIVPLKNNKLVKYFE